MNKKSTVILWFRNDLRLLDNPALRYAIKTGKPLLVVFILEEETDWAIGAASRWWLHYSLVSLQKALAKCQTKLYLFKGHSSKILSTLAKQINCEQVVCSRLYEPNALKRDLQLKKILEAEGIQLEFTQGNILFNPKAIRNKSNGIYRVFTAFYKACLAQGIPSDLFDSPKTIDSINYKQSSLKLEQLGLLPKVPWDQGLIKTWQPGEPNAHQILNDFIDKNLIDYSNTRDNPAIDGTTHLSPYLRFGEISPRRIIYQLNQAKYESSRLADEADKMIRQLLWREFSYHMLVNFPHTTDKPFQEKFSQFPWKRSDKKLEHAWQQGQTGYPIVDAGMRELWQTGYMHNRVRMIVASFLTKNGLLHWKKGAKWFWDTLVDADLAQNTMNWQWVAGCGVDAAPYFRIFNPITQSQKFDTNGTYVGRWCPELKLLDKKYIHSPWTAPVDVLQKANITLGVDYPLPILNLQETRERALTLFRSL